MSFLVGLCLVISSIAFSPSSGVRVEVRPTFSGRNQLIPVLMTRDELTTVQRLGRAIATTMSTDVPSTESDTEWIIEPSAIDSKTLSLSRRVLRELQILLESLGMIRMGRISIVIGRTQRFINESLSDLDCFPNLVRTGGIHLMGATVCNRSIIIINLTGYFFLRKVGDQLTSAMETMPEPLMRDLDYRIADRNVSGLAHEWAHIARAAASDGRVPINEPAWIREGFAEIMAGVASVRAFPARSSYKTFHVVRLRKFANWESECTEPLRRYRLESEFFAGCEYYLGALAVEYLAARMGGLSRLVTLFRRASELMNFPVAFRLTYGLSIGEFEKRMDSYLQSIAALPNP